MQDASPEMMSIFAGAIERRSPGERAAFLDAACGADVGLRRRIEALLRAHEEAGGFLQDRTEVGDPVATVDQPDGEGPGTVIGPYKLLQPIGEGGFGVVFLAEQTEPLRRKVALKVLKPGMDTRQVVARFAAERQALAIMDHPNIAKVFDGGATPSGRPYFVMELVKGVPITAFCDREQWTPRRRLELFVSVCQAVQHAHQKGIIHRDLKPSNVLVSRHDSTPVVKVIDFGVAKAVGQELTDKTLFTGVAQMVGTPLYMSPEQAGMSDLDVDTRSDIYSLGVLLYELLTGTTPFTKERFRRAAYDEIRRIIREEEPPRPSTRLSESKDTLPSISAQRHTEPAKLTKLVRGELDWIVMKALEKDRGRRYETANGFATDVQRYLADEPVLACPPSAAYRFRKFARRNKRAIATTMLVAAALVAGTVVSTWQAIRATNAEGLAETRLGEVTDERNRADSARQDADRRATEAREVVDFLINDLIGAASPDRAQGMIPTVDQVLDRADQNVAKKFASRPLIEASIRLTLSHAYEELGRYPKAEQHAARAVELRLKNLGPEHVDTIAAENALGEALHRQSEAAKTGQESQEKAERVRALLSPVLDTARKALGPEHEETLDTMEVLAAALFHLEKSDEARALWEQVLSIRKRVLGPESPKTLSTMNNLALSWQHLGDLEKAAQLYEQILAIALRDRPNHPSTLIQMSNLAYLYESLNQNDRSIDLRRRIMEGRVRVLGLGHHLTLNAIGAYTDSLPAFRADWEEVRRILEPLLDRSRREQGPESEGTIALTGWLANTLSMLGRTEKAVALVDGLPENRQALDVREALARHLYSDGHRDVALIQFQRVEALRPRLVPADEPLSLWIRTRLALVLREHGRFAEARPLLEQTVAEALRLRQELPKPDRTIESARGIAQFLLGRWPGFAPGVGPAARPPAPFTIEAPFRGVTPIADGRIAPGEYGPGIEATFVGDSNPGRLWAWGKSHSKAPEDLSVRIHAAYTDRSLFLAFRVRDQFVDADAHDANVCYKNDSIAVYIDGDQVANDLTPVWQPDHAGNREGFQLTADAAGHRIAVPIGLTDGDWKVGTVRASDGYIIEFEIPLTLIDTRDGPEYVPATSGDQLRVNFAITDNDASVSEQTDYGIFWAEDPALSPYGGGEDFWTVSLRLVPKPSSIPRSAAGR